jgi:hypothetical protein
MRWSGLRIRDAILLERHRVSNCSSIPRHRRPSARWLPRE